ncbi:MAG TPA: 50S ribosomal protein L25 [Candidatus Omnitrophota bacterium]|nr:50S ribosomal protein L25 [Candidatus Omnitrophota bacterium]HPS20663.1 50S ribosomal protein L25 [Candidatus Omnitrophota bacterium]
MEKIIMKATAREVLGKGICKRLRKDGSIPGVVYKGGDHGMTIFVDGKELWKALHTAAGENAIITLDITGSKKTVIVKEVQTDPMNDKFVHVDFHEISLTEKIRVKVPVRAKGEPEGVKEGGVLNQVLWELEIECLPTEIPEHIDLAVEKLKIGDAIHIKDVAETSKIHIIGDSDQVVIGVVVPHMEEEKPKEEALTAETEPELIKKGKKEEEGAEGEAAAPAAGEKKAEGPAPQAKK